MTPTLVFLCAAALLAAAIAFIVVWPLLRTRAYVQSEREAQPAAQKASLREAMVGIEAELARGEIDVTQADVRRREVLLRARAESEAVAETAPVVSGSAKRGLAALFVTVVAVASAGLYLWVGNPNAMNPQARAPAPQNGGVGPAQVAEMVKRLEAKLSAGPPKEEDLTGWKMLARSQMVMEQFGKAAQSYRTALSLAPGNAELETSLAESLLAQNEGKPSEEIEKLLTSAYGREPTNPKILWLSAAVAQERGDKAKAIRFLKEARATLAPESEEIKMIDKFITDLGK
jgi:cytochrome c-type biogenesis protein CcmH